MIGTFLIKTGEKGPKEEKLSTFRLSNFSAKREETDKNGR